MSGHIPGTTDEHRLLAKMTTPDGIDEVVKSGLTSASPSGADMKKAA